MSRTKPLILASQSPRRRILLTEAGFDFQVMPPDERAECGICSRETPPELVSRLAYQKAGDVASRLSDALVIGCDTVAECRGQILGKPANREHAREMLQRMSGRIHHVYSGLCLWSRPDDQTWVEVAVTKLRMDSLSEKQLEKYLDSDDWIGKAGAFGFQDGLDWVHVLEGSESNVVGLPLELFDRMLERAAWPTKR